jgi:hypothetical protein
MLLQLLQGQKKEAPLDPVGLWLRTDLRDDELIQEFRRECRIVRKGMEGDLVKVSSAASCQRAKTMQNRA